MKSIAPIAAALLASIGFASSAVAQTGPGFVDFTFTGTVTQAANDTIVARNPGGSLTTLSGDQIPDYRYSPGDQLTTRFRFLTNQSAFADPRCNGRYSLGFTQQLRVIGAACSVELASVQTPFGQVGLGGSGGDSYNTVVGLELLRDPAGDYSIAMPTGSYSMRYVGVNPYYYDSATGELRAPNNNICIDAFNCPDGAITGTPTGWTTSIPIAGDFGLVRPGLNVGYNAGSAGIFSVAGLFSFGSNGGGNPTDVPAPSGVLLFGGAVAALIARRKKGQKAKLA
jgi:hypothetical protein